MARKLITKQTNFLYSSSVKMHCTSFPEVSLGFSVLCDWQVLLSFQQLCRPLSREFKPNGNVLPWLPLGEQPGCSVLPGICPPQVRSQFPHSDLEQMTHKTKWLWLSCLFLSLVPLCLVGAASDTWKEHCVCSVMFWVYRRCWVQTPYLFLLCLSQNFTNGPSWSSWHAQAFLLHRLLNPQTDLVFLLGFVKFQLSGSLLVSKDVWAVGFNFQ